MEVPPQQQQPQQPQRNHYLKSLYNKPVIISLLSLSYVFLKYLSNKTKNLLKLIDKRILNTHLKQKKSDHITLAKFKNISLGKINNITDMFREYIEVTVLTSPKNPILNEIRLYNYNRKYNWRQYHENLRFVSKYFYYIFLDLVSIDGFNSRLLKNDYVTIIENDVKSYNCRVVSQGNIADLVNTLKQETYVYDFMSNCIMLVGVRYLFSVINKFYLEYRSNKEALLIKDHDDLRLLCNLCKLRFKSVIIMKCGHFNLCGACYNEIKKCVLCGNIDTDVLRVINDKGCKNNHNSGEIGS